MAERDFHVKPEAYGDTIDYLRRRDCYFINGMLVKSRDDVVKQPRVSGANDIPKSFHWFAFSPEFSKEDFVIKPIKNIHMGLVYAPVTSYGGPFLEIFGFWRQQEVSLMINVSYRPEYWVSGIPVKAPEKLKKIYREVCIFLNQYKQTQELL